MRTGRKAVGISVVAYLNESATSKLPRFGFVVSKSVGSAVERNLVKRRLRAAIKDRLQDFYAGQDLVIRALPSAKEMSWDLLTQDLDGCLNHLKSQPKK
jgi:ribonuclease P protein component